MRTIFQLAWRILKGTPSSFTRVVSYIAFGSALVGSCTLFCSIAILEGFRSQITDKIYNLHGQYQILPIQGETGSGFIEADSTQLSALAQLPSVIRIKPSIQIPALLKTEYDGEGILLKAHYSLDANSKFFDSTNTLLHVSVSRQLAQNLQLTAGQQATVLLLTPDPSYRKIVIDSIWSGGIDELDAISVYCDERQLKSAAGLPQQAYTSIELHTANLPMGHEALKKQVHKATPPDWVFMATREISSEIFDWLDVIGRNVDVILVLIISVICINCAGTILIFTLDKTSTIGLLNALGTPPAHIQLLFWFIGAMVALPGLLLGFLLGFVICLGQQYFQILTLNPESYYLDFVPIKLTVSRFLWPMFTLIVILLISQVLPTWAARRLKPVNAIKQTFA